MNHFTRAILTVLLAVFSLPSWAGLLSQVTPINDPALTSGDYFGSSGVVISNDGLIFAAASPYLVLPSTFNDGTGTAQAFQYIGGTWVRAPYAPNVNGPPTAAHFGAGLAVSADGSELLYGFGASCGTPMSPPVPNCAPVTAELVNTELNVGLYSTFLDPTNTEGMASDFGASVALSSNGHVAVVGAPQAGPSSSPINNPGEAMIYDVDGTGGPCDPVLGQSGDVYSHWPCTVLQNPVTGSAAQAGQFGAGVAISANGQTVLVAAYNQSSAEYVAYLYELVGNTWTLTQTFDTGLYLPGFEVGGVGAGNMALSADGTTAVFSGSNGVVVETQQGSPTSWVGVTIPNTYGPVSVSADGTMIAAGTGLGFSGSRQSGGSVQIYSLVGGAWTEIQAISAPTGALGFGANGVALSADKETLAVTAPDSSASYQGSAISFAGIVYVYQSPADLSITGTASPSQVSLNQQTTLAFTVTNNDTAVTTYNVVLTDTLPAGFTSIVTNAGSGATCGVSNQAVTCTLPSLAPGAIWSPSIQASVTTAGNYTDTASATSNQPDPDTSNNTVNLDVGMLPPVVTDGVFAVNADTTGNGSLPGASNPCNCGTLAYSVVQQPAHGTVTITDALHGAFSYKPDAGYLGADSFTFQVTNGFSTSVSAAESITVKDVPPTATGGSATTNVNQPASGTLSATPGYAEQKLTYAIAVQPAHGTVTITDAATGAFSYAPAAGFIGTDSFTFIAGDGTVTSAAATETITVKDVPPTAQNGNVSTNAGQAVSGTLSATPGYAEQKLTFTTVVAPAHGTVNVTGPATGAFTYTPNAGFVGTDSFGFVAGDGIVTSAAATVSITVLDVAPTASNGNVSTTAGQVANGTLSATPGYTGQMLSYAIVTQPVHGKVTLTASSGAFVYTPDNGYVGADSFTFTAGDGIVMSATATISVTVQDIAPTANNGSASTTAGQAVSGTLSATPGYSGQALAFNVVAQPAHGGLTYATSTGAFTYTPASGYSGSDSFTFTVDDGTVTSAAATESITIKASSGGGGAFGLLGLGMLAGLLGLARRRQR